MIIFIVIFNYKMITCMVKSVSLSIILNLFYDNSLFYIHKYVKKINFAEFIIESFYQSNEYDIKIFQFFKKYIFYVKNIPEFIFYMEKPCNA